MDSCESKTCLDVRQGNQDDWCQITDPHIIKVNEDLEFDWPKVIGDSWAIGVI